MYKCIILLYLSIYRIYDTKAVQRTIQICVCDVGCTTYEDSSDIRAPSFLTFLCDLELARHDEKIDSVISHTLDELVKCIHYYCAVRYKCLWTHLQITQTR